MEKQKGISNIWEGLPAPQNHGGTVTAFVSPSSATFKTSLTALYTQYLRFTQMKAPKSLILPASFTWEIDYYLDPVLKDKYINEPDYIRRVVANMTDPNYNILNEYLENKMQNITKDDFLWKNYLFQTNERLDIIPSNFLFTEANTKNTAIEIANIIGEARREYELIVLDTASGTLIDWLPMLSTVNHVIVPFNLNNWRIEINTLWWLNNLICQLKILGYPIAISGIIPFTHPRGNSAIPLPEVTALKKLFGSLILPTYFLEESLDKYVYGLQEVKYVSKFKNLLEPLIKLTSHKPKPLRNDRRERDQIIYLEMYDMLNEINYTQKNLSLRDAAEYLSVKYKNEPMKFRHFNIQRTMEISIFGNKTPRQCELIFERYVSYKHKENFLFSLLSNFLKALHKINILKLDQ